VTWWQATQVYVAVTAALGVILGCEFCRHSDTAGLTKGYAAFKAEAAEAFPDYQPKSVNVDGWDATQNAWASLFPTIIVMRCFLHLVLGVQNRCRSLSDLFDALTKDLWNLFRSQTRREFGQRVRRLLEWTARPATEVPQPIQAQLAKVKTLAPNLKQTFDQPEAARTSNAVDRMMNYQDRRLYAMQYFHGTESSAQQELRSMSILWNFHLYIPKVRQRAPYAKTPFEALNGFCYHDHWLRNLLIAASLNGRNTGKFISHKVG
jgi:hypothetical protein